MNIAVNALPGVGAEISGIDIAGELSAESLDVLKDAFASYGLLFFRDQSLDESDHIRFAQAFGDINVNRFFAAHPRYPEIALVAKEAEQTANIGGGWHTDHSYDEEPALGSILVAKHLPPTGGDTWFSSMYSAFEALSPGLKATLHNLRAVHSARHVFGSEGGYNSSEDSAVKGRIGNAEAADGLSDPVHPVVIKHPLSGRPALYVNPAFTLRFEGWTAAESAPLLAFLYEHAASESFVTRFQWQPGSVAFWDNRATWHFAQNDYQGERRVMHRITVDGCALEAAAG